MSCRLFKTNRQIELTVKPPNIILGKINNQYLLVITKEENKIKTGCSDENYNTT